MNEALWDLAHDLKRAPSAQHSEGTESELEQDEEKWFDWQWVGWRSDRVWRMRLLELN